MKHTTYLTDSSMWLVDTTAKVVTRLPRTEDPTHPNTSYETLGSPVAYDTLEVVTVFGGQVLQGVIDGVPFRSGYIL